MSSYKTLVEKVLPFKRKGPPKPPVDWDGIGGALQEYALSTLFLSTLPVFASALRKLGQKAWNAWRIRNIDNYFYSVNDNTILVSAPVTGENNEEVRIVFGVVKDKLVYASTSQEHLDAATPSLGKLKSIIKSAINRSVDKLESRPRNPASVVGGKGTESSKLLSYAKGQGGYTVVVLEKNSDFDFAAVYADLRRDRKSKREQRRSVDWGEF